MNLTPTLTLLSSPDWQDYALLDSGGGRKLERYGAYVLSRPEPQALWKPALSEDAWHKAHAIFLAGTGESGGTWDVRRNLPKQWPIRYKSLRFFAQVSGSRHLGFFPEQADHWDWIETAIRNALRPINVLNLFGYTGVASLAAARGGANVTHVDASKRAVSQARQNQQASDLMEHPIRWLVDDAFKFVQRELRRGSTYEGLILDPPKFGRGPQGQVWELFESLTELLGNCRRLLSRQPLFVVITAYAIRLSALSLHYAVEEMLSGLGGKFETGELVLVERSAGRLLATALFTRWLADGKD